MRGAMRKEKTVGCSKGLHDSTRLGAQLSMLLQLQQEPPAVNEPSRLGE